MQRYFVNQDAIQVPYIYITGDDCHHIGMAMRMKLGDKVYVSDQVRSFIASITDIKKELVEKIVSEYSFNKLKIVEVQEDVDVNKYLFELYDKEHIEAVLMKHDYGNSICVSSQVGCNMGCKFCESGRRKKVRNLEAHEMVQQIMLVEENIKRCYYGHLHSYSHATAFNGESDGIRFQLISSDFLGFCPAHVPENLSLWTKVWAFLCENAHNIRKYKYI